MPASSLTTQASSHRTAFTIQSQSLVGGTYVGAGSSIEVRRTMRRRSERGQSLVETALVLPILLIILMGIFDFGQAIAYNAVSNSARASGTPRGRESGCGRGRRRGSGQRSASTRTRSVTFTLPDCPAPSRSVAQRK